MVLLLLCHSDSSVLFILGAVLLMILFGTLLSSYFCTSVVWIILTLLLISSSETVVGLVLIFVWFERRVIVGDFLLVELVFRHVGVVCLCLLCSQLQFQVLCFVLFVVCWYWCCVAKLGFPSRPSPDPGLRPPAACLVRAGAGKERSLQDGCRSTSRSTSASAMILKRDRGGYTFKEELEDAERNNSRIIPGRYNDSHAK